MLRITKQTDYGIMLLGQLAVAEDGTTWTARELAESTGIPGPMVAKILKLLAHGGLLTSQRGAAGGYALARPAAEVSMVEIVEQLEGPIAMTSCCSAEDASACGLTDSCRVRVNWQRINARIRDAIAELSLADMVEPARGRCGPRALPTP